MKAAPARALLTLLGLLLIGWGMAPRLITPAAAAPYMLVTETPPIEPPTSTPVTPTTPPDPPTATLPPATPTATLPPEPPTATPPPVIPTEPPDDGGDVGGEEPREQPTATPEPTATPTAAPLPPAADPTISKSVSPSAAVVGDSVTYTILVTNQGGAPASGVVVEDTLPGFLDVGEVSATRGQVSVSGQSVRVEIGDLAAGESVEIRVQARVRAAATPPNNTNLAVVSSSPDSNPDNNQASVPLDTIVPAVLPATSGDTSPLPLLATILGLILIAASVFVRRGAGSGSRSA